MSARYSCSPTLRLPIAESRLCTLYQCAFVICLFVSLALVALRGYPWLAAALTLGVALLVPALFRQPMAGLVLCWRDGCWFIHRDGVEAAVTLHSSCRASPVGIYLSWSAEEGVPESVWLFADSAPGDQLRRLRVRLALER